MTTGVFEVCTPKVIVKQVSYGSVTLHICVIEYCFGVVKDEATLKRADITQYG